MSHSVVFYKFFYYAFLWRTSPVAYMIWWHSSFFESSSFKKRECWSLRCCHTDYFARSVSKFHGGSLLKCYRSDQPFQNILIKKKTFPYRAFRLSPHAIATVVASSFSLCGIFFCATHLEGANLHIHWKRVEPHWTDKGDPARTWINLSISDLLCQERCNDYSYSQVTVTVIR